MSSPAQAGAGLRTALDDVPQPGATLPVADGLHWLRMPLPFALAHINLWLLDDGDGFSIVDTGVDDEATHDAWRQVLAGTARGARINRVVVTHLHPDHAGNAGWLCREYDCPLWMTREEYLLCRVLTADTGRAAPEAGVRFYRAAGFPDNALNRYEKMFGMFGRLVSSLPDAFRRLKDGDRFDMGQSRFEVIIGRGHSPEHACLFDAERNLVIAGDQILPKISSNVSVFPTEPAANPLADWLASLEQLKMRLPDDVLVLPAHGRPFYGVKARLDELISEHMQGLDALLDLCREPKRVVDVFPALFRAPIRDGDLIMATGESIAHLNYLLDDGAMEREQDADGVDWYRTRN